MTDQPNPGTSPGTQPDDITPTEPWAPPYEPADAGTAAPAQTVAREGSTAGTEAPANRRSSGIRWAVALVGVAAVIGVTAAFLALASGRPTPSIAVGYMPADTASYGEYRLDLPGDQRAKMAAFLSKFPGFADQANVQTKLYEVFDRIVGAVTNNEQTYTANVEPWFGGQIAMGSGRPGQGAGAGAGAVLMPSLGGGLPLIVVSVKDQAKATAWLTTTVEQPLTETDYNGITLYGLGGDATTGQFAAAVTDKVMLLGIDAAVKTAIDSKGEGKLADDAEFKAAFGTVARDYVSFSYTEYRALIQSLVAMAGEGSGLDQTAIDDELIALVPAWQASSFRFEDDAIVGDTAYPSIDLGFDAKNKKSTLIGHAPAGTIFFAESHDVGPAADAVIERIRTFPELRESFGQVESAVGVVGGFDGLIGWWGDAAIAVTKDATGTIGGGLLIQPTDAANAKRTFETLRSFVVLAGGASGIELRDVEHNGATITVIDVSAIAQANGELPPGVKAELAYTVTDDLVVIGYGEAFVASVLDAGPGPSLADDARVGELLTRSGDEGIGLSFVDIKAIRELIEPLARDTMPAEDWAMYEREIRPYLLPFDALASGARVDGDLDRLVQIISVK